MGDETTQSAMARVLKPACLTTPRPSSRSSWLVTPATSTSPWSPSSKTDHCVQD
ncbi:hypothetical protein NP493_1159g00016 [Ridgeia piscesae]|uniref:Uncharacterized protein n=1 Tax=Ridgeia piscesae TaxID=27915 RepID=A0AAD9KEY6_RIDPI|nr:hypothetical protein NP493_1159g00016 [Ridgeia piscesae]